MRKNLHPTYFKEAAVHCACGRTFTVGSTQETIETEICSACHPFFSGKEKVVDAAGRVDRFKKRQVQGAELRPRKAKKARPKKTLR